MTALVLILSAMAVVGVAIVILGEYRHRQAARERADVEAQIDDLWVTLWVDRAEAEGRLPSSPPDQ